MANLGPSAEFQATVIAGGGGGATMASGLAEAFPEARVSVVVPTGDSGSKTGRIRELFGGVAVGDISTVQAASSTNDAGEVWGTRYGAEHTPEDVATHSQRLLDVLQEQGDETAQASAVLNIVPQLAREIVIEDGPEGLRGHRFGNLAITAFNRFNHGDMGTAIQETNGWLRTRAAIIPATVEPHELVLLRDGLEINRGEHNIDSAPLKPGDIEHLRLELETPDRRCPTLTAEALGAISSANIVIVGPGSPLTSLLAGLGPHGMAGALEQQARYGELVAVANLVEEETTPGMDVPSYIRLLRTKTGRRSFDWLVYNTSTQGLPKHMVPTRFDPSTMDVADVRAISGALVGDPKTVDVNDPLAHQRGPVHDAWAIAELLSEAGLVTAGAL